MELKNRIKNLREAKNLTHSQLAAVLRKSEGTIRSWETGRSRPDVDILIVLTEYFGCTTDYLLGISNIRNESKKEELDEHLKKIAQSFGVSVNDLIESNNWKHKGLESYSDDELLTEIRRRLSK